MRGNFFLHPSNSRSGRNRVTQTILLIEDNLTDEKLTRRAFDRCEIPHQMTVVRDGAEALSVLLGSDALVDGSPELSPPTTRPVAELPSLVLLDLKLPRVSGLEILRRVRANPRTRLLPVIMLTASREEHDVRQCYLLGANAYIRKPVDFTQFVDTAKTIGHFWLQVNEPPPVRYGDV